jgi:uncharacterized lipoprotein YddW (UPF0748 family)
MQRCPVRWRAVLAALALASALVLPGCRSVPEAVRPLHRAMWIDRWDWRSRAEIEQAMADCHDAGFTAVLFQVRGNGTALWRSKLEVWSEKFSFRDPGFDPLQVAVDAAHAHGLQCHAWLNALPAWTGEKPPADPRQLWVAQPGWFLQTRGGDRQKPAAGKYLTLNPCLPEVRRYVADLCREVAANYRVDGIHLDYIRFPDAEDGAADLGCDARTLSLFTVATGARLDDTGRLKQWQADCVTSLVEECGQAVRSARSDRPMLTAAVFADLRVAHEKVRQDWPDWCRRRLVDAVMPMNYAADDGVFSKHCYDTVKAARSVPVVMGIGLYKMAGPDQAVGQLDAAIRAGAFGVAVFNYRTMFGTAQPAAASARTAGSATPPASAAPDPRAMRQRISAWLASHAR